MGIDALRKGKGRGRKGRGKGRKGEARKGFVGYTDYPDPDIAYYSSKGRSRPYKGSSCKPWTSPKGSGKGKPSSSKARGKGPRLKGKGKPYGARCWRIGHTADRCFAAANASGVYYYYGDDEGYPEGEEGAREEEWWPEEQQEQWGQEEFWDDECCDPVWGVSWADWGPADVETASGLDAG